MSYYVHIAQKIKVEQVEICAHNYLHAVLTVAI